MKKGQRNIDQRKLVLYLLDEISQAGQLEVDAWLADSQENRNEYEALKKTWLETGKLNVFPKQIDVDFAWDKLSKRLDEKISHDPPVKSIPAKSNQKLLRFLYAAAAVLFLAWATITLVHLVQGDSYSAGTVMASNEEVLQDSLSDGSTILLNENSTLKIANRFNSKERKVELTGEAFFKVKPDSTKPFIIDAGLGQVKVLGTSFQVKGFPRTDLEVFVEEGSVELSGKDGNGVRSKLILSPGDRGIIKYPGGELILGDNINPDDLFWAKQKLIFEETRLSLVFELLKKHYSAEIEIENNNISGCLLSATFNDETVGQILAVIAVSFDLTVEKVEGKFIIKGKGCENE